MNKPKRWPVVIGLLLFGAGIAYELDAFFRSDHPFWMWVALVLVIMYSWHRSKRQ